MWRFKMSVNVSKSLYPLDWDKNSTQGYLDWRQHISDELKRMYFEEHGIKPIVPPKSMEEQVKDAKWQVLTLLEAKRIIRNGNNN